MTPAPAKTFTERLPPILADEENEIAHLSDEMVEVLYPGRRPRPFLLGVTFDAFGGPNYERAVDLARRGKVYREKGEGVHRQHHATFDLSGARVVRDLFELVGKHPGTEVRIDGRRVPYAQELWLPLYYLAILEES